MTSKDADLYITMGEKSAKKSAILSLSPVCYVCGTEIPVTVDHFPPRVCFIGRHAPEGFEFPACEACNQMTRFVEQAVGCYVHLLDRDETRQTEEETFKHLTGILNNFPELAPIFELSANEKRRAFRTIDPRFRVKATYAEEPVISISPALIRAFDIFALKMVLALYFRHMGRAAPNDHYVYTHWRPFTQAGNAEMVAKASKLFPIGTRGERRNTEFGSQLLYRHIQSEENELFSAIVQVRQSVFITGAVIPNKEDLHHLPWKNLGNERAEMITLLGTDPKRWLPR